MKVKLINEPTYNNAIIQVLHNRGIDKIDSYIHSNMNDIYEPELFGEDILKKALECLITHIYNKDTMFIIVDADADGFTSSALFINYLHDAFPYYTEHHIKYFIHLGKQHGLSDCIDLAKKYKLVIIPDAGSNDYEYHKILKDQGTDIIVLDHHEADHISENAIIINNQLSNYPNKQLSGVGVTWQFCRYLDKHANSTYANDYLDLVALGNTADMQSMKSIETKTLIFEGFKEDNIKNPFIYYMAEKNSYPLGKTDYQPSEYNNLKITPMGAAFFIAPFVNAMVRSGTLEEKELIFKSMLKHEAFKMIPSTKRGHKLGEQEKLVIQAIRVCTNVKNRQTKAENEGLEHLEHLIEQQHLMNHKMLLFLLNPGEVDKNIAGLIANKFMAKYQRPVAILTEGKDKEGRISFQGSARGYDASGVTNFKDICAAAPGCIFAEGHQSAFGLGLGYDYPDDENLAEVQGEFIYQFIDYIDEQLKNIDSEPCYSVDYIWNYDEIDGDKILQISELNDYWGKDVDRALVFIKNIPINENTFKVMKSNTLRYSCPGVDIIQFNAADDQIEDLSAGSRKINAICKCGKNAWMGAIDPQLILVDYEVIEEEHNIITDWGF